MSATLIRVRQCQFNCCAVAIVVGFLSSTGRFDLQCTEIDRVIMQNRRFYCDFRNKCKLHDYQFDNCFLTGCLLSHF